MAASLSLAPALLCGNSAAMYNTPRMEFTRIVLDLGNSSTTKMSWPWPRGLCL